MATILDFQLANRPDLISITWRTSVSNLMLVSSFARFLSKIALICCTTYFQTLLDSCLQDRCLILTLKSFNPDSLALGSFDPEPLSPSGLLTSSLSPSDLSITSPYCPQTSSSRATIGLKSFDPKPLALGSFDPEP